MARSRVWYYRIRGQFYTLGPMRFAREVDAQTVRSAIRKLLGLTRGELREVWPVENNT